MLRSNYPESKIRPINFQRMDPRKISDDNDKIVETWAQHFFWPSPKCRMTKRLKSNCRHKNVILPYVPYVGYVPP
jgi:hypothetical protein